MSKPTRPAATNQTSRIKPRPDKTNSTKPTKPQVVPKTITTVVKPKSRDEAKSLLLAQSKSKDEERSLPKTLSKTSMQTRPKILRISGSGTKATGVIRPRMEARIQPLKAKYTPEILEKVDATKQRNIGKSNVMNTVHNVTVLSPPPKKKEILNQDLQAKEQENRQKHNLRIRTRTRTLEPDEVVVLKNIRNGPKSLDTFLNEQNRTNVLSNEPSSSKLVKGPVSFEIVFDEKNTEKVKSIPSSLRLKHAEKSSEESDGAEYEDDFESYESDFETGSSSAEASVATSAADEEENEGMGKSTETESESDESEETQPPITVIHRDKDDERKLDSGSYDLNSRKEKLQQFDSMDSTLNSEQLDSGISYNGNFSNSARSSAGVANLVKARGMSKRGTELMEKITLDTVSFTLFELHPVKYEWYMKIYGNYRTTQTSTQTNENRMEADCQTDEFQTRSIWTQHPPQYDLKFMQENSFAKQGNAFGEFSDDEVSLESTTDPLSSSIRILNRFKKNEIRRSLETQKQIDFDRLNDFLNKSVLTITSILSKGNRAKKLKTACISISNGYHSINTNFLSALRIVRVFSSLRYNLVLAVHESVDEIYKSDFLNLISVWSINEPENPIRLLSTWSEVCRVEICAESSDIVVGGLRDGSIAMWDLRETYSFCSKLDGYLKHFAATQSITPVHYDNEKPFSDLGAVVDIKSFKEETGVFKLKTYKTLQFASLNDTGILTIWTLVETGGNNFKIDPNTSKFEYSSPWARVKLTQSALCDLKEYLQLKHIQIENKFDKTRSYFENDIFSDEILKELHETQQEKLGLQGLRFTNLDTSVEHVYVATNRNFIISCSKTLKSNRFGKIFINESKYVFPTAMKLFGFGDFLIAGLSNGSVIALNCNQDKPWQNKEEYFQPKHELNPGTSMPELEVGFGKSCAIQNIIRSERRPYETHASFELESTEAKSNPYGSPTEEIRIYDQQILLDGSVLRKSMVQHIEISNDYTKLYALSDGNVRVYDFVLNRELGTPGGSGDNIQSFGLVKETSGQQNLILLTKNSQIQIHYLK